MYMLVKEAKLANAGVYHQYCPMAFNDKGAYWLSNEAEIKNPYFGKKMLECGEVKDSL
jgi:Cu(I)/Ag(I) efflux system membrane fusion protein